MCNISTRLPLRRTCPGPLQTRWTVVRGNPPGRTSLAVWVGFETLKTQGTEENGADGVEEVAHDPTAGTVTPPPDSVTGGGARSCSPRRNCNRRAWVGEQD